jgi:hypothetical protein
MTQEKANKIFQTEIGQQLDMVYVTSDDMPFIRYSEAVNHSKKLSDNSITEWWPEDKEE